MVVEQTCFSKILVTASFLEAEPVKCHYKKSVTKKKNSLLLIDFPNIKYYCGKYPCNIWWGKDNYSLLPHPAYPHNSFQTLLSLHDIDPFSIKK
jgi:hypothetical protein